MIELLDSKDWIKIYDILLKDPLRNYFNLLGLISYKEIYQNIFLQTYKDEVRSILLLRRSGTLKFYPIGDFNVDEVGKLLKELNFKQIIAPRSYCKKLVNHGLITEVNIESYLATLIENSTHTINKNLDIRRLEVKNLDEIEEIYKQTFKAYAPREVMESRVNTKRGRMFGLYEMDKLVSVAQTEFESSDNALIVGVATLPTYQNRGYSTQLMKYLINLLRLEGKSMSLEYESTIAAKLYKDLGFEVVDHVVKYEKRR